MTITPNPLIPAGAAATVSRLLERMRDDACQILRKPSGVDAGGAPVSGPYSTVTVVACRVVAPGRVPLEAISGGRFGPAVDYEIFMAPETDVRSDDRIAVNGRTMEISADDDAVSHGFQLKVKVKVATS